MVIMQFILMSCQNSNALNEPKSQDLITESDLSRLEDSFLVYNQYDDELKNLAKTHSLDWIFLKAIIIKESHFDDQYISTAGAVGLMQLMPREGSFVSESYRNFAKARLQKRNQSGERIYQGKKDVEWAADYVNELDSLRIHYQNNLISLYEIDSRFNPSWNLNSGINQLSNEYQYFYKRGHGSYGSRIYALAAYNAGRGAVVKDKTNRAFDRIPINKQTELYVGYIERIYSELRQENGLLNKENEWILKI